MKKINQKGFTLVELLVAAALGVLLLSVVVAIFLSSKRTFTATQGIARSQETTRFAVAFLKRDIRLSGYRDCAGGASTSMYINDTAAADAFPPSLENAIFGWEFNGTDSGDSYTLAYDEVEEQALTQAAVANSRGLNTAAADQWTGNFIQGSGASTASALRELPALIAGFQPLKGSDILAVTTANPLTISLQQQTNQRAVNLNVVDVNGAPEQSGIPRGTLLQVGDCSALDMFQNSADDTDTFVSLDVIGAAEPGNRLNSDFQWQKKWGPEATLYQANTRVYFVGTGAGGKPALFVYSTNCGLSAGCSANQAEVVEGVESMQILYGEDTNQDGTIERFLSADNVVDFRGVRAVKLSLLVRSTDGRANPNPNRTLTALDQAYNLNGQTFIVPPEDGNLRFVNSTTVDLPNRGL